MAVMQNDAQQTVSKAACIKPWEFAPETKLIQDDAYLDLVVIDLSEFDPSAIGNPIKEASQRQIITNAMKGLSTTGFLALKGHGLSHDQLRHQFAIGRLLMYDVPEEEKHKLHSVIKEGNWAGYKPQGYHKSPDGTYDTLETYDLYPYTAIASKLPTAARPYLTDIRRFIEHNHYHILSKILAIISLGLGLDVDTLWKLHQRGGGHEIDGALRGGPDDKIEWNHTKDVLGYSMYHPAREDERAKKDYLLIPGHTDFGTVTFLYSQPVAALQVLSAQGEWKYVRYYPDHIIVNIGDCLEFVTGGILKAAPHRVKEPPEDQRHLDRLGVFYFVSPLPEVLLCPIDHPTIRERGGKDIFQDYYEQGGRPFMSDEWMVERSKLVGTKDDSSGKIGAEKVLHDIRRRYTPSSY